MFNRLNGQQVRPCIYRRSACVISSWIELRAECSDSPEVLAGHYIHLLPVRGDEDVGSENANDVVGNPMNPDEVRGSRVSHRAASSICGSGSLHWEQAVFFDQPSPFSFIPVPSSARYESTAESMLS